MTVLEQSTTALSTLGALTGIIAEGPTMTRGGKLLSVRGLTNIRSLTAGDGPFLFGIADKGISLVQLEEYLEQDGPVSPDVVASREVASRGSMIRTLGVLIGVGAGTVAALYLDNVSLKGLKFGEENAGWNKWLYNCGVAMSTGATWVNTLQHFVEFNPSG